MIGGEKTQKGNLGIVPAPGMKRIAPEDSPEGFSKSLKKRIFPKGLGRVG
jgi:hypothetical protein